MIQRIWFSSGGVFNGRFAIRLAAGFGSQLVLLAWQKGATTKDSEKYDAWLRQITDTAQTPSAIQSTEPSTGGVAVQDTSNVVTAQNHSTSSRSVSEITKQVLAVIAAQTGYETSDLDLEYELEADLGIDTVKQAELFAELRETFNVPDDVQIEMTTAPTIQSLIDWFHITKLFRYRARVGSNPLLQKMLIIRTLF